MTEGICEETQKRVCVTLWAYAYEIQNDPWVSDDKFDRTCEEIDLEKETSRPDLDKWFKDSFDPCTGQWIHSHPELDKAKEAYKRKKLFDLKEKYDKMAQEIVNEIEINHSAMT